MNRSTIEDVFEVLVILALQRELYDPQSQVEQSTLLLRRPPFTVLSFDRLSKRLDGALQILYFTDTRLP